MPNFPSHTIDTAPEGSKATLAGVVKTWGFLPKLQGKLAESPLDLVALFRPVIEGAVSPEKAVREYHAALAKKKLSPKRSLADDLLITEATLEGYKG
mgnify:CR=1 FL=1